MTHGALDPAAEHLLRDLAPRVLGALVRRTGRFADAEDAVQDAVLAAVEAWSRDGVPQNPGGWLFHVAWRRLTDRARSDAARARREQSACVDESAEPIPMHSFEDGGAEESDDSLILLFTCCHPALTQPSAIALTLRAVGGLTTAEIARAFLVPEATMAQRITRAKQTITESELPFALPTQGERAERLDAVLHVLYLIFNEGYASGAGAQLQRVELATEAIRLARALRASLPDDAEVAGLLSLMLLTDARRRARTGPRGELIPLDEQDRSKWDRGRIDEGVELISATLGQGAVGAYQLQAAIAALHDEAPRAQDTDWPQILALYGVMRGLADNPMVELNHVIALAMVEGPGVGLERLAELESDARIAGHYRLDAVRAHLLEFAGDRAAAIESYRAAAKKTTSIPERDYLVQKAARLSNL